MNGAFCPPTYNFFKITGSDLADTEMQTVLSAMVFSLGPIRIFVSRLKKRRTFLFLQDFPWGSLVKYLYNSQITWNLCRIPTQRFEAPKVRP